VIDPQQRMLPPCPTLLLLVKVGDLAFITNYAKENGMSERSMYVKKLSGYSSWR
jgi:hypothetical protein